MPSNPELILHLRPVAGEVFSVRTADFAGVDDALAALGKAVGERGGLTLHHVLDEAGSPGTSAVLINFVHIVSVEVRPRSGPEDKHGQYL